MKSNVACIHSHETLQEAARVMAEKKIGMLVVLRNDGISGMITDEDIALHVAAGGDRWHRVQDVLRPGIVSCHPEDTLQQAAEEMRRNHARRILVIGHDGALAGVVSHKDISNAIGLFFGSSGSEE